MDNFRTASTVPPSAATPAESNRPPLFLATAATFALGGAGYVASVVLGGDTDIGAATRTPLVATANALAALAGLALAVQLPTLTPKSLPRWCTGVLALGIAFAGAFAFALATVVPHFGATVADPDVFAAQTLWMDAIGYPKQVLLLVGFLALAVIGRRRQLTGWPLTALCVVTALVNGLLWPYAPGAVLAGITLAWFIGSTRRETGHRPD